MSKTIKRTYDSKTEIQDFDLISRIVESNGLMYNKHSELKNRIFLWLGLILLSILMVVLSGLFLPVGIKVMSWFITGTFTLVAADRLRRVHSANNLLEMLTKGFIRSVLFLFAITVSFVFCGLTPEFAILGLLFNYGLQKLVSLYYAGVKHAIYLDAIEAIYNEGRADELRQEYVTEADIVTKSVRRPRWRG